MKREITKGSEGDPFDEFPQVVSDAETLKIKMEIEIGIDIFLQRRFG